MWPLVHDPSTEHVWVVNVQGIYMTYVFVMHNIDKHVGEFRMLDSDKFQIATFPKTTTDGNTHLYLFSNTYIHCKESQMNTIILPTA